MSKAAYRVPVVVDDAAARHAAALRALQANTSTGNLFLSVRSGAPDSFFQYARVNPNAVKIKDDDEHIPLHWFALRGDTDHCRSVLAMGSEVDAKNKCQQTPLFYAVISGNLETVELLIRSGANIEARDVKGSTPLLTAVQYGHNLIFLHLLDRGADLERKDNQGCSAAHWGAAKNNVDILRMCRNRMGNAFMLEEDYEGYAPIHRALCQAGEQATEWLVDVCGQDPTARMGTTSHKLKNGPLSADIPSKSRGNEAVSKKDEGEAIEEVSDEPGGAVKRRGGASQKSKSSVPNNTSNGTNPRDSAQYDTVGIAEVTLKTMVDSAASGGTYAGEANKPLIDRQRSMLAYIRQQSDNWKLSHGTTMQRIYYFLMVVLRADRVKYRALGPMLYLGLYSFVFYTWWSAMMPASGAFLVFIGTILVFINFGSFFSIYAGNLGALDPYNVLGRDNWTSRWPWYIFQHPFRDQPSVRRLPTSNHIGNSIIQAPQPMTVDAANPPRTKTGEIDYEALVDIELGNAAPTPTPASSVAELEPTPTQLLLQQIASEKAEVKKAYGDLLGALPPGLPAEVAALADPTKLVTDRICYSCEIVRPLRSKHDYLTDRCYDRYDHYCTWTGSPITRLNHVRFLVFLVSQFVSSVLALLCLWFYLNDPSGGTGIQPATLYTVPLTGDYYRISLILTSYTLIFYTVCAGASVAFTWHLMTRQYKFGSLNVTTNEHTNGARYAHFQAIRTVPSGADGAPTIAPDLQNPFDHLAPIENFKELLNLRAPRPVTLASIAARDASQLENAAREMHIHANETLKRVRADLEARMGRDGDKKFSQGKDDDGCCHDDHEKSAGLSAGKDGDSLPATAAGMAEPNASPAEALASLPREIPFNSVRTRAFASRVALMASRAWERAAERQNGHGHSHGGGGGGHGHSHGGDEGHGHSHGGSRSGGGGGHGHSHGGGGGGGSGGHGHSHGGGGGGHGHSHGGAGGSRGQSRGGSSGGHGHSHGGSSGGHGHSH